MKPFVIVTFYKFFLLKNCESIREFLLAQMKQYAIKGTIILASEGMNGSFCATKKEIACFISKLKEHLPLGDTPFRETYNESNPFDKAKVKLRKEIVSMGVDKVEPEKSTGVHVNPQEWNALLTDPNVLVIDTRNDYEVKLGTFKGAINPQTVDFRDFPEYVQQNLVEKKDKKIAMYCTGGIRCEKSTAYLKQLGFKAVYQLEGGILNYLESISPQNSLWEGSCFVFDNRIALDENLNSLEKGSIDSEWKNKNRTHVK